MNATPERRFAFARPSAVRVRGAAVLGALFAAAVLALSWLARASLLVIALRQGYFDEPHWAQLAWLAPALGYDVSLAAATGAAVGALKLGLDGRAAAVAWVVAYLWLAAVAAVFTVSLPLYGALQVTLHWNQLLLAGGMRDLVESGLGVVPVGAIVAAAVIAVALGAALPRAAAMLARVGRRGVLGALGLALLAPGLVALPMPLVTVAGLERNAAYDFVASVLHEIVPRAAEAGPAMDGAPHFDSSPMFDRAPPATPTSALVEESALPLRRANVALVVLESASVHQVGLWGGKPETVPRLRELSDRALLFDAYYASTPVSMKSLLSMHCSTYAQPRPVADTYSHPRIDCRSLSEILAAQGYRTGLFHGGRFGYTRKDRFFTDRGYEVLFDSESLPSRKRYRKVPWGVDDRAVLDDALAWLDQGESEQPFFLTLIFLAPHHPYELNPDVPTPFGKKSVVQRYRNATAFIDSQIGRLWDWLVAHGRDRDTLLVVAGDHGEAFGERPGQHGHGHGIYEESVRTPLMLVNERLFRGARTDRVANHLDLVPTVLDVLGLPREERHQGQSLLRGYAPRTIHFWADWHGHYRGLRDGRWKYIHDVDRDAHELYDLGRDPRERKNLAAGRAKQVRRYARRARDWERFYDELLPNYDRYVGGGGACEGRATCWLDEVKPIRVHGKLKTRGSLAGESLRVGREKYDRGFGVQPLSILAFRLEGSGFRRLRGGVGHHAFGAQANLSLQVAAEVYVDDRLVWSSGKLVADEAAKRFDLSIEGAKVLELVGHDVDGETWRDYLDWVDVRLER